MPLTFSDAAALLLAGLLGAAMSLVVPLVGSWFKRFQSQRRDSGDESEPLPRDRAS